MTFFLRVPSDGNGPSAASITSRFLEDSSLLVDDDIRSHQSPKEFEIFPDAGTLEPQSEIEIQVLEI